MIGLIIILIFFIVQSVQFSISNMIYGQNKDIFGTVISYFLIASIGVIILLILTSLKSKHKLRKLDDRFNYYVKLDENELRIKIDSSNLKEEKIYKTKNINFYQKDNKFYTIYCSEKNNIDILTVNAIHFDPFKDYEFEDRLKTITKSVKKQEDIKKKFIKKAKNIRLMLAISLILFIGVFTAYFATPSILKTFMPETNKIIINKQQDYQKYIIEEKIRMEEQKGTLTQEQLNALGQVLDILSKASTESEYNKNQKEVNEIFNKATNNIFAPKEKE